MDKLLYIAASGAKQDLLGASVRANNLANAQTTGFKAQLEQARAMPAFGERLSPEDIGDVAAYMRAQADKGW